ncbi:MAG TPA: transposase [Chloroflexia bacterium]|nr:transposase [Chloroflexia bacterium]
MSAKYPTFADPAQTPLLSSHLAQHLQLFLAPLTRQLTSKLDVRLVRTFFALIIAIISFRERHHALLLSQLGAFLVPPHQAPAGAKRLHNLIHSPAWSASLIQNFFWRQAAHFIRQLKASNQLALVIWDDSVIEKNESRQLEGLCSVRSTKAARLKKVKKGFYSPPPGPPIFVPGMQWSALIVSGLAATTTPWLGAMHWWSTRGENSTDRRTQQQLLLEKSIKKWGKGSQLVHVFDQGYVGKPWLGLLLAKRVNFVLRWRKDYNLVNKQGRELKCWKIAQGKRSWDQREVWDSRRRCWRKAGIVAFEVNHPQYATPLWLVVARLGQGITPWYLLTNRPVKQVEAAWEVMKIYSRRWQIEEAYRYTKSELGFESPRLQAWEDRLKLLMLASLAFAYLLSLLKEDEGLQQLRERGWCHRTGKRLREEVQPLYRLRWALSRLWQAHPPPSLSSLLSLKTVQVQFSG